MDVRSSLGGDRLPLHPIRIYSVAEGDSVFCRILGTNDTDRGIFTHWTKSGSVYCPPEGCPPANHSKEKIWKGYVACDVWNKDAKLWLPAVLEITENLGVDLRRRCRRGQVWELRRLQGTRKQSFPVEGRLCEELSAEQVPAEFDIVPVLIRRYHCISGKIDLSAKNPMPDRVWVAPSADVGPRELAGDQGEHKSLNEDDRKKAREIYERHRSRMSLTNGSNGLRINRTE